jgi:hypothetical protein
MFDEVTNILNEFAINESSILPGLSSDDVFLIGDNDFTDLVFDMGEVETTEVQ